MLNALRIVPCGDRSLLVYAGSEIDPGVNQNVHALARALREQQHPALVEITPAYHCLLVEYDPLRLRTEQLEEMISTAAAAAGALALEANTVEIPVRYGGEMGPDLETVAAHTGLQPEEVVRRHHEHSYRVYCLGFSPGFPYLGDLDPALHTPRLADPRVRVPAGSVGIGGSQTGVYPGASPGGWQLIGRTPVRLFDPYREPPALLSPGDRVRFVPVDPARYAELDQAKAAVRHPRPAYADGMSGLRIIHPGMATTVQDLGRRGWQAYGVPVAGAADYWSLMVGNWLLGNRARTSALEITMTGPEVEFSGAVTFCLTGAAVPAELIPAGGASPVPVPGWTTVVAGPGDRLRIGTAVAGCRSYLCVAGGIDLPPVLGSLSEDLFGHVGPLGGTVQAGDWLPVGLPLHPPADLAGRSLPADAIPVYGGTATVRVTRGPQAGAFTDAGLSAFFGGEYTVGNQSDRQGLRLQGPQIAHIGTADILSEPIPPGSVQVPANGQPILLMANRQTTGGYTKIATAVYPDLPAAAQLRPGDRLRFEEVTASEAYSVAWAERRRLAQIRRHLEREITRRPDQIVRPAPLVVQPVPAEAPADAAAQSQAPAPAPAHPAEVRRFRITIGGVEIDATVEEVNE